MKITIDLARSGLVHCFSVDDQKSLWKRFVGLVEILNECKKCVPMGNVNKLIEASKALVAARAQEKAQDAIKVKLERNYFVGSTVGYWTSLIMTVFWLE